MPSGSTTVTPITRSRIVPKRCAQRAGEVVEQALADRRVAGRIEREPLPVRARAPPASAESRSPASTMHVRSPGSCSRIRRSEAVCKPGLLERMGAVRARHLAAEPRRREELARDSRGRRDRRRGAAAASRARSSSPNISGIAHALSVPTPCSPVIEPPASTHASRIASRAPPRARPRRRRGRRRARADAGCRRRRGRRCRRAGRARCESSSIRRSTLGQLRARHDAVLHVVVRADPAHRGERRLAAAPDRCAVRRVGRDADLARAVRSADRLDAREILLDLRDRAVELDDQHGAAAVGIVRARPRPRPPRS